jgi:beta-galactosidase
MNKWAQQSIAFTGLVLFLFVATVSVSEESRSSFSANKMESVLYGVAYYPEYMPYDRLDQDVEMMQRAGITVVRVGESTWSSWEPRDGDFQFAWMQRVLDRLHQAGIKAILGTPTYSIPTWLYKNHPEILLTRNGTAAPLSDPYDPTYPPSLTPGYYGPRQNYDFLNPYFRQHAERVIREIVSHFRDHPAVIGYQIDNETGPTGVSSSYMNAAFLDHLKQKYKTPDTINKVWGLVYWGQLVDKWEDLPPPDGILNPGYKLEWENFQHEVVTNYLTWQAKIVGEFKRPDQFITHDFSGGVHTDLDQWGIARSLDIVAENPYFETQARLSGRGIWLTDDLGRSLKRSNFLITETNAQTIGWDSRTQYPQYPGQLRMVVYAHLAAGANMVEYWHWHSLHYGQETYWKGVLSHDLQPNRTYAEVSRVARELKHLGPELVDLSKDNKVAILVSIDSANALSYMPVSDNVNYMTVLKQMYNALYDLNVEVDFVPAGDPNLSRYKVLLVPPLYSASDAVLQQIADYVKNGGHALMAFKSSFADEHSTIRSVMAPGPLRAACGFHYQEFTNLPGPVRLKPDPYRVGEQNTASVWEEFLVPDTAEVIASFDDSYWHFPAITRNKYGSGALTYEGTLLSDALQREVIRDVLHRTGLTSPDQDLSGAVKVRHGRNRAGKFLHYYFNFSGEQQTVSYRQRDGADLLTGAPLRQGQNLKLKPWDLAIISEQ